MIESWQTDAQGICLDRQLVQSDPCGYAKKVMIHNGGQVLEFLSQIQL